MNVNHLKYFIEVCKQGSTLKAADICFVSQPSITSAINTLENELEYKLFYRRNNRLELTKEGELFFHLSMAFLDKYNQFQEEAYDISGATETRLMIGVPSILSSLLLDSIIPDFRKKNPGISLSFYDFTTDNGLNMLRNSYLDFMICVSTDSFYSGCESRCILSTDLQLMVSKENKLAKEPFITKEQLSSLPMVTTPKGSCPYNECVQLLDDSTSNIIVQTSQLTTIKKMVAANNAATLIYADIFSEDDGIVSIPMYDPIPVNVNLTWLKKSYCSKAMRTFISFVSNLSLNKNSISEYYG